MKDLDWSNLSFGYRQTDYNVLTIATANGAK